LTTAKDQQTADDKAATEADKTVRIKLGEVVESKTFLGSKLYFIFFDYT